MVGSASYIIDIQKQNSSGVWVNTTTLTGVESGHHSMAEVEHIPTQAGKYRAQIKLCQSGASGQLCNELVTSNSINISAPFNNDANDLSLHSSNMFTATNENLAFTQGSYSVSHGVLSYNIHPQIPALPSGYVPDVGLSISDGRVKADFGAGLSAPLKECTQSSPVLSYQEEQQANGDNSDGDFKRLCYNGIALVNANTSHENSESGYWSQNATYYLATNPSIRFIGSGRISVTGETIKRHVAVELQQPDGVRINLCKDTPTYTSEWGVCSIEDAYGNTIDVEKLGQHHYAMQYSNGYSVVYKEERNSSNFLQRTLLTIYTDEAKTSPIRQYQFHHQTSHPYNVAYINDCGFDKDSPNINQPICAEPLRVDWRSYVGGEKRLRYVEDAKGLRTEFTYWLTHKDKPLKAVWQGTGLAASNYHFSASADEASHVTYYYQNPKYAHRTQGYLTDNETIFSGLPNDFLGYEKITTVNHQAKKYNQTMYDYNIELGIPFIRTSETGFYNDAVYIRYQSDHHRLSYTTNRYAAHQQTSFYRYINYTWTGHYVANSAGTASALMSATESNIVRDKYGTITSKNTLTGKSSTRWLVLDVGGGNYEPAEIHEVKSGDKYQHSTLTRAAINNDTTNWLIGFVEEESLSNRLYNAANQAHISSKYNDIAYTKEPGTTDVKTTETYAGANGSALGTLINKETLSRNNDGVVTSIQTEGGNADGSWESRTQSFASVNSFGQAQQLSNALYHGSSLTYDDRFAQPTAITDANNLTTHIIYNAFGQTERVISPLGVEQT